MPIITNIKDPFSHEILQNCWAYCANLKLDFDHKIASVTYHVFKDKASAYTGKPPVLEVFWRLTASAQPEKYGTPELISPYVPPVYSIPETDPETGEPLTEPELLEPEQPPVYSTPEVIESGLPAFDEGVVENQAAYNILLTYLDNMALTRSAFAGGFVETEQ